MCITKNHQSPGTLQNLCSAAFPGRSVTSITELTEGMFNAAYRVDFADGGASVLKIDAADSTTSAKLQKTAAPAISRFTDGPHFCIIFLLKQILMSKIPTSESSNRRSFQ